MNTRMIKEALRYKFELDHSFERTVMARKISKGVVAKYVGLSKAAGLNWSQIQAMTEDGTLDMIMMLQKGRTLGMGMAQAEASNSQAKTSKP